MLKLSFWFQSILVMGCILAHYCAVAQNKAPAISNVRVEHNMERNRMAVLYDLHDEEEKTLNITAQLTGLQGEKAPNNAFRVQGDLGSSVATGKNKSIVIEYEAGRLGELKKASLTITADDGYAVDAAELVKQVDMALLKKNLDFITGERNYITEKARLHHKKVADSLVGWFRSKRLITSANELSAGGKKINNIIGEKKGTKNDSSVFIMCAHYDTVEGSPGADDNASGIAALLEVIRILSQYTFESGIRFIAFDREEDAALGSSTYLASILNGKNEKIRGVLNYDMIGYYSEDKNSQSIPEGFDQLFPEAYKQSASDNFAGNFVLITANQTSAFIANEFEASAKKYVPALKSIALIAPGNGESFPMLMQSDHGPFWQRNIPAVHIGDGASGRNPHYHAKEDMTDKLNYTFIENIVKTTLVTLASLCKIQHKAVVITDLSHN